MIRGTSRETCNYRSKETQCNDDGDDGETIIYNMIAYMAISPIWQFSY